MLNYRRSPQLHVKGISLSGQVLSCFPALLFYTTHIRVYEPPSLAFTKASRGGFYLHYKRMALTPEQLKAQVLKAPEAAFAAICAGVDERRGNTPVDLKDMLGAVIQSLKPNEVLAAVKTGLARGDAAMFQKLLDMYEKARGEQQFGDLVVEIEHYTVPDVAIPHIIEHCAVEQFQPIKEAVFKRLDKMRKSPEARKEAKRLRELRAAGIDPGSVPGKVRAKEVLFEKEMEEDFEEYDRILAEEAKEAVA